jgi:hypothetical protein
LSGEKKQSREIHHGAPGRRPSRPKPDRQPSLGETGIVTNGS